LKWKCACVWGRRLTWSAGQGRAHDPALALICKGLRWSETVLSAVNDFAGSPDDTITPFDDDFTLISAIGCQGKRLNVTRRYAWYEPAWRAFSRLPYAGNRLGTRGIAGSRHGSDGERGTEEIFRCHGVSFVSLPMNSIVHQTFDRKRRSQLHLIAQVSWRSFVVAMANLHGLLFQAYKNRHAGEA
jgi:hypothetical protein